MNLSDFVEIKRASFHGNDLQSLNFFHGNQNKLIIIWAVTQHEIQVVESFLKVVNFVSSSFHRLLCVRYLEAYIYDEVVYRSLRTQLTLLEPCHHTNIFVIYHNETNVGSQFYDVALW